MFEILMNLPLFRGVSHEKLAQVVGEAKFHFLKYPPANQWSAKARAAPTSHL